MFAKRAGLALCSLMMAHVDGARGAPATESRSRKYAENHGLTMDVCST